MLTLLSSCLACGIALAAPGLTLGSASVAPTSPVPETRLAPPGGIAVIDLESVFNGLDERMSKATELTAYKDKLEGDLKKMAEDMDQARKSAEVLPEGPDKKAKLTDLVEKQVNLKVKKDFFEALLDQRQGEMFRALYDRISDASRRMAESNKWSLVIASDEKVTIPTTAASADVQRVISLKRLVFVGKEHDVTQDLVNFMNNEYKAAGGRLPPPPPSGRAATPPAPAGATQPPK